MTNDYAAWWPIEDDTRTLAELTTEATPQLAAMIHNTGHTIDGHIRWATDDRDAGLVLLALAPVVAIEDAEDDAPPAQPLADGKRPAAHVAEDAEWLLSLEPLTTTALVADRLGMTPKALSQALGRANRIDLRDKLTHNSRVEQNYYVLGDRPARKSGRAA